MKKAVIGMGVLALVFFAARDGLRFYRAYQLEQAPAPSPTPTPSLTPTFSPTVTGTPEPATSTNIIVSAPARGAALSLPFTVSGSARTFESVVVIAIKGASGEELYKESTIATAPDAGQFGPFTQTVTYLLQKPVSSNVTLEVFWNSPKDGTPLDVVRLPLVLDASGARTLKIFFPNAHVDSTAACAKVFPVERIVAPTQALASAAIEVLLKGPSAAEQEAGYTTVIPPGVEMPNIVIAQGTATVTFKKGVLQSPSDACSDKTLRTQIEQTLYQFPTVSGVELHTEG